MRPGFVVEFAVIIVLLILCGAADWFLCAICDDAERDADMNPDTWRDE